MANLEKSVNRDKKLDLLKHKKEISRLVEQEIASRYFYQRGRIENMLATDEELREAYNVLADANRYANLLKPGK
jgi:carboxyl-terminal processing protease